MNDGKNTVYFCIKIGVDKLSVSDRDRGFDYLLQENWGSGNSVVFDDGDRDFLVKVGNMKESEIADWMTSTGSDLSERYSDVFYIGYGPTIDAAQDDLNRNLGL